MGQNDKFLPGPTTTFTRWGVTQQTITASTPKEAFFTACLRNGLSPLKDSGSVVLWA